MNTEHTIPSRLFLAAGKEIETALRAATYEAFDDLSWHSFIATWEDGKVVIIPRWKISFDSLGQSVNQARSDENIESLKAQCDNTFLNLVRRKAFRIYIQDNALHLEFPQQEREFALFLANPENAGVLSNICRDITGREMVAQVAFAGTVPPAERLRA